MNDYRDYLARMGLSVPETATPSTSIAAGYRSDPQYVAGMRARLFNNFDQGASARQSFIGPRQITPPPGLLDQYRMARLGSSTNGQPLQGLFGGGAATGLPPGGMLPPLAEYLGTPPSPGLGSGTPNWVGFDGQGFYPGHENDPLLQLLTDLLNRRFP